MSLAIAAALEIGDYQSRWAANGLWIFGGVGAVLAFVTWPSAHRCWRWAKGLRVTNPSPLRNEISALRKRLEDTARENVRAQSKVDEVKAQADSLLQRMEKSLNELEECREQRRQQESELARQRSQLAELTDIVALQKREVLIRNETFHLGPRQHRTIQIPAKYAGALYIDFTATTGVLIETNQAYQSNGELLSGPVFVPVCPLNQIIPMITFRSGAIMTSKTVKLTITYIY